MIRLALLDDHPAVLSGLRRLLGPAADVEVIAAAGDEVALARALDGRRADVVLMDYDPVRGNALALCRRMKGRSAPPRVLLYTAYASPALALATRAAQADGLIDKGAPAATVLDAIRRVCAGQTVIPPVGREDFEAALTRLDGRDRPIFAMLLDGVEVPGIADALRTDERQAARRAQRVVERLRPRLDRSSRARRDRGGSRSA